MATKKYKLGDKWSEDFDYDGMWAMYNNAMAGKLSNRSMLRLADSVEDVNYHEECRALREKAGYVYRVSQTTLDGMGSSPNNPKSAS